MKKIKKYNEFVAEANKQQNGKNSSDYVNITKVYIELSE